jgi:hypothetical protein
MAAGLSRVLIVETDLGAGFYERPKVLPHSRGELRDICLASPSGSTENAELVSLRASAPVMIQYIGA